MTTPATDKVELFARRIVSRIFEGGTEDDFEADVVDVSIILREFAASLVPGRRQFEQSMSPELDRIWERWRTFVMKRRDAHFNAAWTSSPSQAGNNAEGEKSTTMLDKKKTEVLFKRQTEFYTDDIVRIDAEYFFRHRNGGTHGAWDSKNFREKTEVIDRTEARRLALEWGENLETVAETLS